MEFHEVRSMLGLVDSKKCIYQMSEAEVTAEEYAYCQVVSKMLWGDHGLVASLGPTWAMVHDPRFWALEDKFLVERPAVFGGDARQGKSYVTEAGPLSQSLVDLESYAEIIGEGRHFLQVVQAAGYPPRDFYQEADATLWQFIHQECPNYFANNDGTPNSRASRLFELFRGDLLGLLHDYSEVALLQDWAVVDTGEHATEEDMANASERPVVWAEIDYLERALTLRGSLRITASRILKQTGLMDLMEQKFALSDHEIDEVLKLVYMTPFDQLYTVPGKVMNYLQTQKQQGETVTQRLSAQCKRASQEAQQVVAKLKAGEITPFTLLDQVQVDLPETPETAQIEAMKDDPNRQELFCLFVEAEQHGDTKTMELAKPILDDTTQPVSDEVLLRLKQQTLTARTSSAIKNLI